MRFAEGIAAQPQVLARSAKAVADALGEVAPVGENAVVVLTGVGANDHVARGAAAAWRSRGLRAVGISAPDLMQETAQVGDVHVGLSESGRSAETVAALRRCEGRRLGVTNHASSPMATVTDELLLLDSGPDSPVYTTGYTATLQAVGMLGEHWSGGVGDWSALAEQADTVLSSAAAVLDPLVERFDGARILDVVGTGAAAGAAGEGALILREAARAHTATHDTYNYLHGPMEPLDPATAVVVVGEGRELRLARDVSALGCPTVLVTADGGVSAEGDLQVVTLPTTASPLAAEVLRILPFQLLALRLAERRGLAVEGFRYHQDDTKLGEA